METQTGNLKTTNNSIWRITRALRTQKKSILTLRTNGMNHEKQTDSSETARTITSRHIDIPLRTWMSIKTSTTKMKGTLMQHPLNDASGPNEFPNNIFEKSLQKMHRLTPHSIECDSLTFPFSQLL